MSRFKVESDVAPIPTANAWKEFPFECMGVGDSFLVPSGDELCARHSIYGAARSYQRWSGNLDYTISVRKVDGGLRVFRTK